MRFFTSVALALALASPAAAQVANLNGTITELFPSGSTTATNTSLIIQKVNADGSTTFVKTLPPCFAPETANCVAAPSGTSRTFNATEIPLGKLLLNLGGTSWVPTNFNHQHDGASAANLTAIQRLFSVSATIPAIPASGGNIPVIVDVRRRWPNPVPATLNIVARLSVQVTNSSTTNDSLYRTFAVLGPVAVPGSFTSSGQFALGVLSVPASENAGASYCAQVDLYRAEDPSTILGFGSTCSNKRP